MKLLEKWDLDIKEGADIVMIKPGITIFGYCQINIKR